jgi:hypothetical protein
MNSSIKWICNMAIAVMLAITTAGIAAYASGDEPISKDALVLVGHWRKTTISFGNPKDEHLVLSADGTAENWVVTASSRSATTTGTWKVDGKFFTLLLEGNAEISLPFTIYEGQLVFPNIQNRRSFWEKIAR